MKKCLLCLVFVAIILMRITFVADQAGAWGVSQTYSSNYPWYLEQGEQLYADYRLQNMVGGEDIWVYAWIKSGSDIITLLDEDTTYFVPFGTKNVSVPFVIDIPWDYELGYHEEVLVSFLNVPDPQTGGGVGLTSQITVKTPGYVLQGENQVPIPGAIWLAGSGLVCLLGMRRRLKD